VCTPRNKFVLKMVLFVEREQLESKGKGKVHPTTGHEGPEVEYEV
jgi:hypothetical protein